MKKASFDPGFGQKIDGKLQRIIEADGSFAVDRTNVPLSAFNPYLFLISLSWPRFFATIVASFATINAIFAALYMCIGLENLNGAEAQSGVDGYLNAYFFSVHTFTTVGYGNMSPHGILMNCVSIIEILCGVLCVALITGLLYGRFSRPSARMLYSDNLLVAPYNEGMGLMFRVANARRSLMVEPECEMMVMLTEQVDGKAVRSYRALKLERNKVIFLPLTWTIVHPLDEESPLYGMSYHDLKAYEAQFLILIKGFDDMFSQVVHSRASYTMDHLVWGARFDMAHATKDNGRVEFDVAKINAHRLVDLPMS